MTWRIRIIESIGWLCLISVSWDWLRKVLLPEGTTPPQAMIMCLIIFVLVEILHVRREALDV